MSNGPRVSSGHGSKQDFATPHVFIQSVIKRFGPLAIDLAAHAGNTKVASFWFGPGSPWCEDSFEAKWSAHKGNLWLNPPFAKITPWAKKCEQESRDGAEVLLLVPASVGSKWFINHAAPAADVYLLDGRICFDGKNVFPKDCLLIHYQNRSRGIFIWSWRNDTIAAQSWRSGDLLNAGQASLDSMLDTGTCHFCGYRENVAPHDKECPLTAFLSE